MPIITVILVFSELSWIFCGKTMNVWFFQIYSAYCGQSFEAKLRMLTVLSFCIFGNHLEHCMAWRVKSIWIRTNYSKESCFDEFGKIWSNKIRIKKIDIIFINFLLSSKACTNLFLSLIFRQIKSCCFDEFCKSLSNRNTTKKCKFIFGIIKI